MGKARNLANLIADGAIGTSEIADSAVTTAKINNGAVTVEKLSATGTPGSGNFLRGDGSWQTISTTPPTDFGAVGTYAVLLTTTNSTPGVGTTIAGSSLRYGHSANTDMNNSGAFYRTGRNRINTASYDGGGTAPSGTWRKMDSALTYWAQATNYGGTVYYWGCALYVRIS